MAIKKILLVDDSKTELHFMSELLTKRGVPFREVNVIDQTASDALKKATGDEQKSLEAEAAKLEGKAAELKAQEAALEAQKYFWKSAGILTAVVVAIYAAVLLMALSALGVRGLLR